MNDGRRLSTEQVAARLGVSRETVNHYALTLETVRGGSLKVRGGARRFREADVGVFAQMRRLVRDSPGIGLEAACRKALETADDPHDGESTPAGFAPEPVERLREGLAALASLRTDFEALLEGMEEFMAARHRLEAILDDCGTEVMEIGARMRDWPGQVQEFTATLKTLTELDGRIQARLQEVDASLDKHIARTLERAVPIWIGCGIGAYVVGFVILPGVFTLLGWRR